MYVQRSFAKPPMRITHAMYANATHSVINSIHLCKPTSNARREMLAEDTVQELGMGKSCRVGSGREKRISKPHARAFESPRYPLNGRIGIRWMLDEP